MSREPNVLYPVGYDEPDPPDPPADPGEVGRDFDRLRTIIRASVPVGGTPMRRDQVRDLVYGRPSLNGTTLEVGVDAVGDLRAAALEEPPLTGITPDSKVTSILPREALVVWDAVIAERESSWTFNDDEELP